MWYVVVNIGCIECGVSSNVVLLTQDKARAEAERARCEEHFDWRESGQNRFDIFEIAPDVLTTEYMSVPAKENTK